MAGFRPRFFALVAALLLAAQGVFPGLALAKAPGADLFDTICSVAADAGTGNAPSLPGSGHGGHCPLCLSAAEGGAALPGFSSPAVLVAATATGPSIAPPVPGSAGRAFAPAQPRAPPSQS